MNLVSQRNVGYPIAWLCSALLLAACQPGMQAPAPAASHPGASKPPAASVVEAPKPSHPALVIQTFDGKTFDLAQHRGKWVVVNFWATWCNPCLKEIPDLDAFDKSRPDVDVIGLAYEEIEKADMQVFLKQHPISYPIALLDVYKPPADFDTPRGLPMTYLIAPDGKVAEQFLGPVSAAELAASIVAHGKAGATSSS